MKYIDLFLPCALRSHISFKSFLIILIIVSAASSILARPGDLDPFFGDNGKVIKRWGGGEDSFKDVLQLPDGKVLVLAKDAPFNIILARYNANGTIDTTFDGDGFAIHWLGAMSFGYEMALQPDGKIVVVGASRQTNPQDDVMVLRFNPDGTFDTTFNGTGKFFRNLSTGNDVATDVYIQPDGKIVIAGHTNAETSDATDIILMRFNPNGSLDTTFDTDGLVITSTPGDARDLATAVEVLPDGKMIVLGSTRPNQSPFPQFLLFAKYESNGALDTSFGTGGLKTHYYGDEIYPTPASMIVQPDGKIAACVNLWFTEVSTLMRFLPDGSIDTGFGSNGQTIFGTSGSYVYDVVQQPDQKYLVVGLTNLDLLAARVDRNGFLDPSFGNNGITTVAVPGAFTEYAWAADLQKDGKLLVAGDFSLSLFDYDSILLRFNAFQQAPFDFDGDSKADVSVFRPTEGNWYLQNSSTGFAGAHFGQNGDMTAPGDFDGDGKTDISVFRPSSGDWFRLNSRDNSFTGLHFGTTGDLPAVGDFDGDGKADISVYRPSAGDWYRLNSANGQFFGLHFGLPEDKPAVGDFDGDGRADISVFRPSSGDWYRLSSSNGQFVGLHFGISEDKPTPADYDGDGRTDISVFRPSTGDWFRINSNGNSFFGTRFGTAGDTPTAADYDGDGKADLTVFRPSEGNWYILGSTAGYSGQHFGSSGDLPTPASFVY